MLFLGGLVLIVLTSLRAGRRGRTGKPAEGERAATIGILVWLGLRGFALYLTFG